MTHDPAVLPSSSGAPKFLRIQPATYSDGHPVDQVHYIESKIILKGERFASAEDFKDFRKLVSKAADEVGVEFDTSEAKGKPIRMRQVLFLDTADYKLYNHAFILRRRLSYEEGFLVGDPEIVFKFRHPDLQMAAETDVRPNIASDYVIKFKAEALPLKDRIGGIRTLYSHNVEFPLSGIHEGDPASMATLLHVFPVLQSLKATPDERVELVNQSAVIEVLKDLGTLDFGGGVTAKSNASVWRRRADEKQLVGEFSFQCKFDKADRRHEKARELGIKFFCELQKVAEQWISLGTTKTGAVYRLKGNPPQSHE